MSKKMDLYLQNSAHEAAHLVALETAYGGQYFTPSHAGRLKNLIGNITGVIARRYYRANKEACDAVLPNPNEIAMKIRLENAEFADRLANAAGLRWMCASLKDREMHVTVNRANYGQPSSAVIEWNGSPSKFLIFLGDIGTSPISRPLFIGNKWFKSGDACAKCVTLIEDFLEKRGFLKRP